MIDRRTELGEMKKEEMIIKQRQVSDLFSTQKECPSSSWLLINALNSYLPNAMPTQFSARFSSCIHQEDQMDEISSKL